MKKEKKVIVLIIIVAMALCVVFILKNKQDKISKLPYGYDFENFDEAEAAIFGVLGEPDERSEDKWGNQDWEYDDVEIFRKHFHGDIFIYFHDGEEKYSIQYHFFHSYDDSSDINYIYKRLCRRFGKPIEEIDGESHFSLPSKNGYAPILRFIPGHNSELELIVVDESHDDRL